jgi:hypothetical protein
MLSPRQLKTNIPEREMPAGTLMVSADGQEIWQMYYTCYLLSGEPQPHFGNTPDRRSKRPWEDGPGSCFCSDDVSAGNNTTGPLWPDASWSAARPTSDQPGTLAEPQWVLHVYRHCDDLPPGNRWQWCRYRCLKHIATPPSRWTFDTEDFQS